MSSAFAMLGYGLGGYLGGQTAREVLSNGFSGAIRSATDGESFVSGYLSGGFGSLAAPYANWGGQEGAMIKNAIAVGAVSILGGGKFANGAISDRSLNKFRLSCSIFSDPSKIFTVDSIQYQPHWLFSRSLALKGKHFIGWSLVQACSCSRGPSPSIDRLRVGSNRQYGTQSNGSKMQFVSFEVGGRLIQNRGRLM